MLETPYASNSWALGPWAGPTGPWARAQGPGPGPFAKLLNEFVSQRSYFLLASLNYLMNLFPRRSYFLLASLNYLRNALPRYPEARPRQNLSWGQPPHDKPGIPRQSQNSTTK